MMNYAVEKKAGFLKERFDIDAAPDEFVVALAGNPNVGKSTIFNALTGLHQHTGNWPGKTVDNAQGRFSYRNQSFLLVDLPGTYSILAHSVEEEVARDFICFGRPDAALVVLDASCLERNLNLALQIMEITPKVVICVNLLDEAARKGIEVHLDGLAKELGVPVVGTTARSGKGLDTLQEKLLAVALGTAKQHPRQIAYAKEIECAVAALLPLLDTLPDGIVNKRWLAMRLLENESTLFQSIAEEVARWKAM